MEEVDRMAIKRNYIVQLEKVLEEANKLYEFRDIYSIRPFYENYQFSDRLDDMVDYLQYEIERQNEKLNDLEVTVYNATKIDENKE